jgi:hypothetical protein
MLEEEILMYRYEVATIINGNRNTIAATNDLEIAKNFYESTIRVTTNEKKVIVFLYAYDKNANIEYYDSSVDLY